MQVNSEISYVYKTNLKRWQLLEICTEVGKIFVPKFQLT